MIVSDRLVYLHLHKSGGSFVNECLLRFLPNARQIGYHLPRSLIPEPWRALPVMGFVRNPWSYYVSWFSFQSAMARPNALFTCMSDGGRLGFKGTIGNLLELGRPGGRLDALLPMLPDAYVEQGLNLPRFALEPIRGSGLGFYSYLYQHMYGHDHVGSGDMKVGQTESLRTDLLELLRQAGVTVSPALVDYVQKATARNMSVHQPFQSFYDETLRDHVAERDAALIAKYGYEFPNISGAANTA